MNTKTGSYLYRGMLLWSLLVMSACQTLPQIHAIYDHSADLGSYRTFGFHPQLTVKGDDYDKLSTRYIKNAIRYEMENRGYRLDPNPQLWVNFNTYTQQKLRLVNTPEHYPSPYYHFRYNYGVWPGYPLSQSRLEQYTEGTLNIDVIDTGSKKLLWEGIAIGRLSSKSLENLEANINLAVRLIFEKFP